MWGGRVGTSYRWIVFSTIVLMSIVGIFVLSSSSKAASSSVLINEVMYCPSESDSYYEWIELYNPTNTSYNVSKWTLWDGQEEDTIIGNSDYGNGTTIIPPYSYALLTDQGTLLYDTYKISNNAIKLYVDDATLAGNGLKNTGEYLLLNNSNHQTIDQIEWGDDTPKVPGIPTFLVNTGESLIRQTIASQTSSLFRFTWTKTPTPGSQNIETQNTPFCPQYLAKPSNAKTPGRPCSYRFRITQFPTNTTYQLKAYLVGNLTQSWPASQTWDDHSWRYANNYTHTITTNQTGAASLWLHLRLTPKYQEFQQNLRNASTAYLIIKFRNQTHTYYTVRNISLLDVSSYTTNATPGGYLLGQLQPTTALPENTPLLATTNNNHLLSLYFLENNSISDDNSPTLPGYYKLAVPIGKQYTIQYLNQNLTSHPLQNNLQVQFGEYTHYLKSDLNYYTTTLYEPLTIPIYLHNNGAFTDTYTIMVTPTSTTWATTYAPSTITLAPKEIATITITTTPHPPKPGTSIQLEIQTHSLTDPIISKSLTLTIKLDAPDLLPTNVSLWDTSAHKQHQFIQGQQIRIKAHIKNQGTHNATNVTIAFYHQHLNTTTYLGSQYYTSISTYYKYPSIILDTTGIPAGTHTIEVITDPQNTIKEADETNNKYTLHYSLIPIVYDINATALKITELYYHTYPNLHNEYIALYNPTPYHLNISGWYLTTTPEKRATDQYKIIFPTLTIIPPYTTWYITQNATAFYYQTSYLPHYEYEEDTQTTIPTLNTSHTITLSNTKGTIALKTPGNITIDFVCYGTANIPNTAWWIDNPLPSAGAGRILKRVLFNQKPIDTNSSYDWNHNRIFKIGQSTFTPTKYTFYGSVTPFVSPDCSHRTIIHEIEQTQHTISLNMYEFTSPTLYQAILDALHRNISVKIFMEGSPIGGIDEREQYILTQLQNAGAQIRLIISDTSQKIYARYPFDHAKYLILDNKTVIVESCNWVKTGVPSDPSFGNREWGIVIHNTQIAEYFNTVFAHDYNPLCSDSCSITAQEFQLSDSFMLDTSVPQGNYIPSFNNTEYQGNFTIIPVFSPDTSNGTICQLIDSAHDCIYIQQLYIYPNWTHGQNPFVTRLIEKAKEGLDIRVILNYNPAYDPSNEKINLTKKQLTKYGIKVKYLYTNWSIFTNSHTKGMIVDNTTVLISSINWNENSVLNNREAGVIVENPDIAEYFAKVFFHDWNLSEPHYQQEFTISVTDFKNQILIVGVYTFTFALIIHDWRKREWN